MLKLLERSIPVELTPIVSLSNRMWNEDGEPPTNDKYWSELSAKEQQAAIVLGYSEEKWNDGSSSDSSTSS